MVEELQRSKQQRLQDSPPKESETERQDERNYSLRIVSLWGSRKIYGGGNEGGNRGWKKKTRIQSGGGGGGKKVRSNEEMMRW